MKSKQCVTNFRRDALIARLPSFFSGHEKAGKPGDKANRLLPGLCAPVWQLEANRLTGHVGESHVWSPQRTAHRSYL